MLRVLPRALALLAPLVAARGVAAQAPLGPATPDSPITLEQGASYLRLDLTRLRDETAPVIRLGFQSELLAATQRRALARPDASVRHVPTYALNVAGTPSGDVARIFGDGRLSAGADVQLSLGLSYLASEVVPRTLRVARTQLARIEAIAEAVEGARRGAAADSLTRRALAEAAADERRIADSIATARAGGAGETLALEIARYAAGVARFADAVRRTPTTAAVGPRAPAPRELVAATGGAIYDALYLRVGANAGTATLFDPERPFATQLRDENFQGYSAQVGYSLRVGGRVPFILAASGGVRRASNVEELSSTEVSESQRFTSPDGSAQRSTADKRAALVGTLEERTRAIGKLDLVLYPGLAADRGPVPSSRPSLALDLFGRAERGLPTVYGVGAYLTRPGSPTSVYGGVNVYRATTGRAAVDLVAGFPL